MINIVRSLWSYEEQPNGTFMIWTKDTEDIGDGGEPIGEIVANDIPTEAVAHSIVRFHNQHVCTPDYENFKEHVRSHPFSG